MSDYCEIKKRGVCPKAIFYEDKLVIFKKSGEIEIPTDEIDYIEYVKPTLLNYLLSFGYSSPGYMKIYLKKKIGKTKLYSIKVRKEEVPKLPKFYKNAIGIFDCD